MDIGMNIADLLSKALKDIIFSFQDREYIEIEDVIYDDMVKALELFYKKFQRTENLLNFDAGLSIDHLQNDIANYYVVFDDLLRMIAIVRDDSRKFEKLIDRYEEDFFTVIEKAFNFEDKYEIQNAIDGVSIFYPNFLAYEKVENEEYNEDSVKFHGVYFNIKYKMKKENDETYVYIVIPYDEFFGLFTLLVEENYRESSVSYCD